MSLSHQAKAGVMPIEKPQPRIKKPSRLTSRRKPREVTFSDASKGIVLCRAVIANGCYRCMCGGQPVQPWNPACWHHIFPKQSYPELINEPDNVVLIAPDCHANHETAAKRLPRKITRHANRLAEGNPSRRAYLERTYRAGCPNPKCDGGEVPGGSKGYLLCPDCKGAG